MKELIIAMALVAFAAVASAEYEYDFTIKLDEEFTEQRGTIKGLLLVGGMKSFLGTKYVSLENS